METFRLPAADARLTSKSANIALSDANGDVLNVVNYAKEDTKSGFTIVLFGLFRIKHLRENLTGNNKRQDAKEHK